MEEQAAPLSGGRYQLTSRLGSGGMADVWLAYDGLLDVHRAVKVLTSEMSARARVRDRFLNEARTMARLRHPHIVTVFDVGADSDGRVFLVMELLEGGTLWERVKTWGPLPPRLALRVVSDLLGALSLAHEGGVVHRDIKPQNLLIASDDTVKVTDFGIARVSDAGAELTRTGAIIGTWAYMAPEQRHNAKGVDARSDLYAVGATLYALLTGQDPFDLFAAEMQAKGLAGLQPAVADVIRSACRFNPEDRFDSAHAMQAAVRAAVELLPPDPPDVPPLALPPRDPDRLSRVQTSDYQATLRSGPQAAATFIPHTLADAEDPPPREEPRRGSPSQDSTLRSMDTASREGGGLRSHWWVGLLGTFGVVGIGVGVVGLVLGVGALWWAMRPVEAPSAPPLAAGAPVAAPIGPAPSTPTEPPPEAAGPAADDPPAEPAAPEDPATSTKPSTGAAASTSKRPTATASSTVATSTAPVETSGPTSAAVAAVGAEHQVQAPPDTAIRVTCKGRDGDQLKVNGVAKGTIPARVDLEKGKYTLTIVGLKGQSQVDYTFLEADKGTTVEVCHGLGPPTQSVGLNETDLPSASGIPKPPAGQGMVCVYRPPSLTGAALRTWVYLDNVELGSLANGRYSCGPAAPGTHRVLVAAPGVRETHPASSSGANASFELLKGGVQFVRVNVVTATTAQLTLTGEDAFSVSGAKESKWTK